MKDIVALIKRYESGEFTIDELGYHLQMHYYARVIREAIEADCAVTRIRNAARENLSQIEDMTERPLFFE